MKDQEEVEMEVFRAGSYGAKGTYNETTLQQLVDDYKPGLLEAPLTFDHAQSGPAFGWVNRLRREGDRLVAVLRGVPQAVREMVRSGAYKRRSVELFRVLPQTGRPYLRAVSLLGAATPEVKGLRDICFAANTEADHLEHPDEAEAPAVADHNLDTLRARLTESRLALMFSELRADGYCLPERDAQAIRQLFSSSQQDEAVLQFADGNTLPALDWMATFLRQTLLRAPLGEAAANTAGSAAALSGGDAQFSENTEPRSLALHRAALQVQAESPGLPYRDALTRAAAMRR